MSARMGKRLQEGEATLGERALCEVLDMIDPEHCERAADAFEEDADETCDEEEEHRELRSRHRHTRAYRHHHGCECETCAEEPWWLRPRPGDEGDD